PSTARRTLFPYTPLFRSRAAADGILPGNVARGGSIPGDKRRALGLVGPATFWLIAFFLLPLVFVAVASFMSRGAGGAPVTPLTLDRKSTRLNSSHAKLSS